MTNDCDSLVKELDLPKGKCCTGCHDSWKDDPACQEEVYAKKVEVNGKIYYICCQQYVSYKGTLCQKS